MTNLVVHMSSIKLTPSNKMQYLIIGFSNAYRILLTVVNILRCDWYISSIIFVLKILINIFCQQSSESQIVSIMQQMLLNCGVGEDSWESLGLQGDPTSPS